MPYLNSLPSFIRLSSIHKCTSTLLQLVLLTLTITACGGGGSSSESDSNQTPQDDPAQLNEAPTVVIGSNASVQVNKQISLSAAASDDGLPNDSLTFLWKKESGPGTVSISTPNAVATVLVFDTVGQYEISLSASDGQLISSGLITVNVTEDAPEIVNQAPNVNAGADTTASVGTGIALKGTVIDDGLPSNSLTYLWKQLGGPGKAAINAATSLTTTVTFDTVGFYTLELQVSDGELTSKDSLGVEVTTATAPLQVSAGSDIELPFTPNQAIQLSGSVTGDRPSGSRIEWSLVSGPNSSVNFSDKTLQTSKVTLPEAGDYVLRLSVISTNSTKYDDVLIKAKLQSNEPPTLSSIPDQTVELGETATLRASATDDGLPIGKLFPQWRFQSGPAEPKFSETDAFEVTVTFAKPGLYKFLFHVSDGELSATMTTSVTVEQSLDLSSYSEAQVSQVRFRERLFQLGIISRYSVTGYLDESVNDSRKPENKVEFTCAGQGSSCLDVADCVNNTFREIRDQYLEGHTAGYGTVWVSSFPRIDVQVRYTPDSSYGPMDDQTPCAPTIVGDIEGQGWKKSIYANGSIEHINELTSKNDEVPDIRNYDLQAQYFVRMDELRIRQHDSFYDSYGHHPTFYLRGTLGSDPSCDEIERLADKYLGTDFEKRTTSNGIGYRHYYDGFTLEIGGNYFNSYGRKCPTASRLWSQELWLNSRFNNGSYVLPED